MTLPRQQKGQDFQRYQVLAKLVYCGVGAHMITASPQICVRDRSPHLPAKLGMMLPRTKAQLDSSTSTLLSAPMPSSSAAAAAAAVSPDVSIELLDLNVAISLLSLSVATAKDVNESKNALLSAAAAVPAATRTDQIQRRSIDFIVILIAIVISATGVL